MENYFRTFKFYDYKKRRMSIFARQMDDNHLELFKIACSKKDQFCKQCTRDVYSNYLSFPELGQIFDGIKIGETIYHPVIETVEIKEGDSAKYTFLHHCFSNYAKKSTTVVRHRIEIISGNGIFAVMKNLGPIHKYI